MDRRAEGRESPPIRLKIIPLLDSERETSDVFSNQVKASGGVVDLLVHPFYCEGASDVVAVEYSDSRNRLLDNNLASGKPTIIFEQTSQIPNLRERINRDGTVYLVETRKNNPHPIKKAGMCCRAY